MSKSSESMGFFWASGTLTLLAVIGVVSAATLVWVLLI